MRATFVGSWVPRRCGIATFTSDLARAVRAADPTVRTSVLAIDEPGATRAYGTEVVARIRQGHADSYRAAARIANETDIVNVQHEFGLYGVHSDGRWDDHLVTFLDELQVPAITTLHTVVSRPEPWMVAAVRRICARSAAVVVMARAAAALLRDVYGVTREPLVIPHGAPSVDPANGARAKRPLGLEGRTVLSTFGLVDPRKGLETAIMALPEIVAVDPSVLYLVIGQTHPELLRAHGDDYRGSLVALVERLGLHEHVRFVNEYVTLEQIVAHLAATDVYVTPYRDPDQITSGTLAYALGAGRAVVSTRYAHAIESLADERGLLVGFDRPDEIADAVIRLLRDHGLRRRIEARAYAYGRQTTWPAVGRRVVGEMHRLERLRGEPALTGDTVRV